MFKVLDAIPGTPKGEKIEKIDPGRRAKSCSERGGGSGCGRVGEECRRRRLEWGGPEEQRDRGDFVAWGSLIIFGGH